MYDEYDQYEQMDERVYAKPILQPREDILSSSRGHKKPSGWMFISTKTDIAIVLILLFATGLGIMWFISQLPFFLETASEHYYWAMDLYETWDTPSMRWLFINLVVGVIVATSGLLSAFGGERRQDTGGTGYDKGRVYGASHSNSYSEGVSESRFDGTEYESPMDSSYQEPSKSGLASRTSHERWNYASEERNRENDSEEIQQSQPGMHESHSNTIPVADVRTREIPISMEVPMSGEIPQPPEVPISQEIPISVEMPPSEELPMSGELSSSEEVPTSGEMSMSDEAGVSEEISMSISRDLPITREVPTSVSVYTSEPEISEVYNDIVGREVEATEIIPTAHDQSPQLDGTEADNGKFNTTYTDLSTHLATVDVPAPETSFPKFEPLTKSHTFTIGRVIRRDQLEEFIEPLSRKFENFSRKIRLERPRSFRTEPARYQSREVRVPPVAHHLAVPQAGPVEGAVHSLQQAYVQEPVVHRRRHSAESVPPVIHRRRLSSESNPVDSAYPFSIALKQPIPPAAPSPPLLRQRSIVYPPALLSQASIETEDASPPPSPPLEKAIPPPPPPYLKLPAPVLMSDPSAMSSGGEHPSFKTYLPPLKEPAPLTEASVKPPELISPNEDKNPSSKHARNPSPPTASMSLVSLETGSSSVSEDRSLMVKHGGSSAGKQDTQMVNGESTLDRQESSLGRDDDLHQKIEDFLAKFHENMRLQRQESMARYKRRLLEMDD